jgi:hypothetical protein
MAMQAFTAPRRGFKGSQTGETFAKKAEGAFIRPTELAVRSASKVTLICPARVVTAKPRPSASLPQFGTTTGHLQVSAGKPPALACDQRQWRDYLYVARAFPSLDRQA